jgi:hypothetical protein
MEAESYISKFRDKTGRLPSQVELSKNLGLTPQAAIRALMDHAGAVEPTVETKSPAVKPSTIEKSFLSVGLYGISALTFILSVYFTGLWFTSMFNLFIAGAISVSMVSYMVLSPQAAMFVKGAVKIPLWATFAIALVFSMGSTVAGQYNQLTVNIDVNAVNDRALIDSLDEEVQALTLSIEADRQQRQVHLDTMASLSEDRIENSGFIRTERSRIDALNVSIAEKEARIAELRERKRAELEAGSAGATEERVDFYSWLAGMFGISAGQMEFWVSALPAVFIDIIAALSLNLALSLRRQK